MRNLRCLSLLFAAVFLTGVITSSAATLIDVAFTDASVTSKTGYAATGVTTNDFWNTYDINSGPLSDLEFVDGTFSGSGTGLTVGGNLGVYGNGASDPMYGVFLFNQDGNIIVTVTNLFGGEYDFYLYGHGNQDNQNGVFQLTVSSQSYGSEATIVGSGWLSSFWQEGVQYVEFTNVTVLTGQTITITVEPGASQYAVLSGMQIADLAQLSNTPFVFSQPANQAVF